MKNKVWVRSIVGMAAATALMGSAWAQEALKIGLLSNLEGPFAVPGQDGYRGAEMALKEKNGVAGGKKIEFIKLSSDATPDKAVAMTRKAVEQDKVQVMIGPLSGDEGIAVKNYAKTKPDITFINGSSGAQATTLSDPAANFYRFNTEGAQWMVGLGEHALSKGYKKMFLISEDYGFPYSQVQGFMASYCAKGGKIVDKAWVPLGTKDYASVIAKIPKDIDALFVVLGGSDAVNFLTQYEQTGGSKPMVGGSITVDQTVLNFKGKRLVLPYSLRDMDQAPASAPVTWSEVNERLDPRAFNLKTLRARLDAKGDLFASALNGKTDLKTVLAKMI